MDVQTRSSAAMNAGSGITMNAQRKAAYSSGAFSASFSGTMKFWMLS
jgi:hypothetical protein